MTRYLTAKEVLAIHDREVPEVGLRDRFQLESAIGAPQHSAGGVDAWPDLHHKAAALMRSLAQNQPFIDGNKRTAMMAAYIFYGFNDYVLRADESEMIHLLVDIAIDHLEVPKIADWLRQWAWEIPDPSDS